jgi:hypothetical protein
MGMKRFASYSWAIQSVALIAMLLLVWGREPRAEAGLFTKIFWCEEVAFAKASPTGCPQKDPTPQKIDDACKGDGTTLSDCEACKSANNDEIDNLKGYKGKQTSCSGMKCADANTSNRNLVSGAGGAPGMAAAGGTTSTGLQCMAGRDTIVAEMKTMTANCDAKVRKACNKLDKTNSTIKQTGLESADKCKEANQEAKDTEKENKKKEEATKAQEDKNKDNAKKEGSGGGMPQMPQMPQQKEDPKEEPPTQPDTNTNTASTVATASKTDIENSKLGGDNKISPPTIGFESSTSTNTSTIQNFGGGRGV